LTKEEAEARAYERISRSPLESSEIQALISTAIELYSRAFEQLRENRWWIPLATGFAGSLVGAFIGSR